MQLTPDDHIWWQLGLLKVNSTILFTWAVMALLTAGSWLVSRRLTTGARMSRMQHVLEVVVHVIEQQLDEISPRRPKGLLPFLGTLFLLYRRMQPIGRGSRVRAPHGLFVHHDWTGHLRLFCGPHLRHRGHRREALRR